MIDTIDRLFDLYFSTQFNKPGKNEDLMECENIIYMEAYESLMDDGTNLSWEDFII